MSSIKNKIFLVVVSLVTIGFSQNPVIKEMAHISNLPDTEFYDVLEDEEHYIWLAANKGLYRYNGKSYQRFSHPKQNGNSLFQLQQDELKRIWCNNIYGQIFYVENNTLKLFFDAHTWVKGRLSPFFVTKDKLMLCTVSGVYEVSRDKKQITKVFDGKFLSASKSGEFPYVLLDDTILEKRETKYKVFRIKDGKLENIFQFSNKTHIQSPKLFAFKNKVFITYVVNGKNKFHIIDKKENTVSAVNTLQRLESLTVYNIRHVNNTYWFLTTAGLFVYKLNKNYFEFIDHLFDNESITNVEIDFNNNYWFTTLDNGVFVSPNINIRKIDLVNLKTKVTAACTLKGDHFVFGTKDGKLLFFNKGKLIRELQLNTSKVIGKLYYASEKDKLIVSINGNASFVVKLKDFSVINVNNKYAVAKSFLKINIENLLYGNYKEAIVYNKPFTTDSLKVLSYQRVKGALNINANQFLISYMDKLKIYDKETFNDKELKFKGESLQVNSMAKVNDVVWLSTTNKGLLELKNQVIQPAHIQTLKSGVQINKLVANGDDLWVATDENLYKYQPKLNEIKLINDQEGLQEIINNFILLDHFIVIIQPSNFYLLPKNDSLFKDYKVADIKIQNIAINDRDTLISRFYKLPYNYNKIRLDFNANGFESNKYISYQYRIKQIDTFWHQIPLKTSYVSFNSLSSGTYTFELKAKNVNAKSSILATPITFVITKPFWETWWFYIVITLAIFVLVWLYFKRKLKQKETLRITQIDKILTEKKITNLQLENLRSQMNPHFIFNALNSIQDYIISNEKELASSYLVKFSRLIRMYLDYSQQNEITFQEEINALKLYLELEKVRFEDELECAVIIDEKLQINKIKVPSLFIQPYVENALKHGLLHKANHRKLSIQAKLNRQNKLQITIEDNGIGRQESKKTKRETLPHKPFATKANEERVYLYKNKLKRDIAIQIEDLQDQNNLPLGTKVIITMSIQ